MNKLINWVRELNPDKMRSQFGLLNFTEKGPDEERKFNLINDVLADVTSIHMILTPRNSR